MLLLLRKRCPAKHLTGEYWIFLTSTVRDLDGTAIILRDGLPLMCPCPLNLLSDYQDKQWRCIRELMKEQNQEIQNWNHRLRLKQSVLLKPQVPPRSILKLKGLLSGQSPLPLCPIFCLHRSLLLGLGLLVAVGGSRTDGWDLETMSPESPSRWSSWHHFCLFLCKL